MITNAEVRVRLTTEMSLIEALELEERLAGGKPTDTTEALRLALKHQLDAAREKLNIANREAQA